MLYNLLFILSKLNHMIKELVSNQRKKEVLFDDDDVIILQIYWIIKLLNGDNT